MICPRDGGHCPPSRKKTAIFNEIYLREVKSEVT
jgi:hypothetical protein